MNFLETLTGIEAGDQATSIEMIQARTMLADDITTAIPDCIMGAVDGWRWDAINVLLFIRLKRDNPKITMQQAEVIANRKNQRPVIEELLYFYGDSSKEAIKDYLDLVFEPEGRGSCDKCDHATLDSWLFCPGCGKSLADAKQTGSSGGKEKAGNPTDSKNSSKA